MKKFLLLCLTTLLSLSAWAYNFKVDSLYYNILTSSTVEVTWGGSTKNVRTDSYVGDIVVPSEVQNGGSTYTVVAIGEYAFYDNISSSLVESMSIPETITSIGDYAFRGCYYINFEIPKAVTTIGQYAFYQCEAMESIELGEGITSIGMYAFGYCNALEYVSIPSGELGNFALAYNPSLKEVVFGEGVTSLGNQLCRNCDALESITSLNPEPPTCTSNTFDSQYLPIETCILYVPQGSKELYENADQWGNFIDIREITPLVDNDKFEHNGIYYNVVSADNKTVEVTWGGESATSGTEYYTGVITIPATTTHNGDTYTVIGIGDNAFREDGGLTGVVLPETITYIGYCSFYKCGITEIDVPDATVTIGDYAFQYCNLKSVNIGDGCTSLGLQAFCYCSTIETVVLGSSVASIGQFAFYSSEILESLTSLNPEPPVCGGSVFMYVPKETCTIYVPAGCVDAYKVADEWKAFYNIVEVLAEGDEFEYDGLYYSVVSAEEKTVEIVYGPDYNSSSGTPAYQDIVDLVIPETVTYGSTTYTVIGTGADALCYSVNMKSVTFPSTLTYIGIRTFHYCSALESVTIPDNITSIYQLAFSGCSALKEITIPDGVTEILNEICQNCTGLEAATIGNAVTTMGAAAFSGCSSLMSFTSNTPEPPTCPYATVFDDISSNCVLYVPVGCIDAYKSADVWKNFYDIQEIETPLADGDKFDVDGIYYNIVSDDEATCEVTYLEYEKATPTYTGEMVIPETVDYGGKAYTVVGIGNDAFDFCTFTAISLPETLEYIGEYAFYRSYVKSVTIPNSVTSLGERAFYKSNGLEEVVIGNSVPEIKDYTFYICPYLRNVTIGSSVTSIGECAFFECSTLKSIEIPSSVLSIGKQAFQVCESLVEIKFNEGLQSIGYMSFSRCPMEEIVLPNTLISMEDGYAFRLCENLKKVVIGPAVTTMGMSTFSGDPAIEEVYSFGTTPASCSATVFDDVDFENCVLYVPMGTKNIYAAANVWKNFQNIVEMGSDGIYAPTFDSSEINGYYTVSGQKLNSTVKGVNIVRYADGTVKKIYVK